MEYLDDGDLKSLRKQDGPLSEGAAQFYAAELILAIQFLHSCGTIHR